jgi:hypothetical protein
MTTSRTLKSRMDWGSAHSTSECVGAEQYRDATLVGQLRDDVVVQRKGGKEAAPVSSIITRPVSGSQAKGVEHSIAFKITPHQHEGASEQSSPN